MTGVTDAFRDTMREVATPVCVVTTLAGPGPHGTTVSAFASLSLEPPMVLVALAATSDLLAKLPLGGRFGVNVLETSQSAWALRFARKGDDTFAGVPWRTVDGAPWIEGRGGWLACDVTDLVPGGDHTVVLGTVIAARPASAAPLTYHGRAFGTHVAEVGTLHTA